MICVDSVGPPSLQQWGGHICKLNDAERRPLTSLRWVGRLASSAMTEHRWIAVVQIG